MIKFQSLNHYNNVFLTSDSHFQHKNICAGTTSWTNEQGEISTSGCRDFETIEDMNQAIIEGLSCVGENDVLLHCGDVAFGGKQNVSKYCSHVKGGIILCYGNHDHNIIKNESLQDEFVSTAHRQFVQFKGQKIVLDHFASLVWHQSHKLARLAFGHVHGSNPGVGKSQDVGVDVAFKLFGEYRPFTFKEFVKLTDEKQVYLESHHSPNTN